MKKGFWMLLAMIVISLLPSRGKEMGEIMPAAVLEVTAAEDKVLVRTDDGNQGAGENLIDAIQDMQDNATGYILLDTLEYILIDEKRSDILKDAENVLRPSIKVCSMRGSEDLKKTAEWLSVHRPEQTLGELNKGERYSVKYETGE